MAVAFDASSESHTGTTGSSNQASFSWTHTPVGTPRGVLVFIINLDTATGVNASVTYGGVSVPAVSGGVAADTAGEVGRCGAFFLGSGIPTGAQTITVNRDNNALVVYAVAATVTATTNTEVYTPGIVLLQEDGTLAVQAVDDGSPGTNSVRFAAGMSGLASPPAVGTGSTSLQTIDIGAQGAAFCRETTAGQGARNVGFSSATSDDRAFVHLAVREIPADTTPPTLSAQTVGSITTSGGTPAVTTNEANGTAYMVVVPNNDTPSVTQIKAGQQSSGAAAIANQNKSVTTTGVQTFSAVTGLTSNTAYDVWFVHTDAALNNSTAVKADFSTLFGFNDARQAFIDGFVSAQSEASGWNAKRSSIPVTAVTRTSATVVTLTLPAIGTFDITADETLTDTIPASILTGGVAVVATPTVSITATVASGGPPSKGIVKSPSQAVIRAALY